MLSWNKHQKKEWLYAEQTLYTGTVNDQDQYIVFTHEKSRGDKYLPTK